MIRRVASIVGQVAESALSIVGIRGGTEEPSHTSEPLGDGVELRRYGPRIAAETTVAADEEASRNEGFRRLAGFIFGKNHDSASIAMTAPVVQSGRKIAMTAPVSQSAEDVDVGEGYVIRFFMPSSWTMQTLPTPNDDRVRLVEVPPQTVAVLRFTGDRGPDAVARRTKQLLDVLHDHGFEPAGEPAAWFYDPPWTLPFVRRNEVAVEIRV